MKILTLHCDYINFKPLKKALKSIDNLSEKDKLEKKITEPLVVLTAVEKEDTLESVSALVKNVIDIAKQVNVKNVVLYPYAHLSNNLANSDIAMNILETAEKELKKSFNVEKAPFGYYKEFELKVKGHPLSELSREIKPLNKEISKTESKEDFDYKHLLREISKSKLDTRKLKDNDHRILGQQMDLFSFNETAPGMVFWHNNGLIIRNELINFWREEHRKRNYQEISTPQILDEKLWKISGHWQKYKDNIFLTEYEKRNFAVKPMNCPGGMLVFKTKSRSYREFPMKVAELGIVHRQELSGVLGGLFRVIQFTQDDAHIFCNEEQMEQEIINIIDLIDSFYSKFGFSYSVELSTRPEKRIGNEKMWDKAEMILEKVLKKKKMKFKINKGDGAFYGPKIDFHIKDSLNRTWQCGTIQLDFSMPERFDLEYTDKDGLKKRPIMLHRVIYGSLERFIGILLEHLNGRLPIWLSPIQVRVINFTDRNTKTCEKLAEKLKQQGIRTDEDLRSIPLPGKIKEAELMKIPYIIVIGDKEEQTKSVNVRKNGRTSVVKEDIFIKDILNEIKERN